MNSKVDRRKFLKYVGAGLVAAAGAGAGYYLYSKQPGYAPAQTATIPKGWELATTYLRNNPPVISRIDVRPKYINPGDPWAGYWFKEVLPESFVQC